LDHYQRVRHTFEGPSKGQEPKTPATVPSRIPAPKPNSHLSPPAPTHRPKLKSRTSTAKPEAKGKGKGKATRWDSEDDDDDDDDDDAYVTSNDFATPEQRQSGVTSNGNWFGDVGGDDDEKIYG